MNKARALDIAITAMFREILREDEDGIEAPRSPRPAEEENAAPTPRFDFDESVCEHNGVYFDRAECPVHGPGSDENVTAEELDDITSDEAPNSIQRAARLRQQREREQRTGRLFPEDLPMSGLGPPEDLGPATNIVV